MTPAAHPLLVPPALGFTRLARSPHASGGPRHSRQDARAAIRFYCLLPSAIVWRSSPLAESETVARNLEELRMDELSQHLRGEFHAQQLQVSTTYELVGDALPTFVSFFSAADRAWPYET